VGLAGAAVLTHAPRVSVSDTKDDEELLTLCWVLGDKYDIPNFQDVAMFTLLQLADGENVEPSTIKLAFKNTSPGCKLRLLMAEELAAMMLHGTVGYGRVDGILNGTNFAEELLEALDRVENEDTQPIAAYRFYESHDNDEEPWKWFMVGDGANRFSRYVIEVRARRGGDAVVDHLFDRKRISEAGGDELDEADVNKLGMDEFDPSQMVLFPS
jgi:hypothetical protein